MSSNQNATRLMVLALVVALAGGCQSSKVDDARTKGDIQGLVTILETDPAAEARADAARALAELGARGGAPSDTAAEAADHLAKALGDSAAEVRAAAATGLADVGDEAAVVPLMVVLDDEASGVRDAASRSLDAIIGDLPPTALMGVLGTALGHDRPTVRKAALTALSRVTSTAALEAALRALDDPDPGVRDEAGDAVAFAVRQVSPGDAVAVLVEALGSPSPAIRTTAAAALGDLGDDNALEALIRARGDSDADVRAAVVAATTAILARLPEEASIRVIFGLLNDPEADTALKDNADAAFHGFVTELGTRQAVLALDTAKVGDNWLAAALDVQTDQLATETRRLDIQLDPLAEIITAAGVARNGKAVAGSHKYVASKLFHPAIIFSTSGLPTTTEWWAPTALRFLELVVVEKTTWKRIQLCRYYGPDISRYRATSTVTVYAAATGKVVAQKTFTGSAPRQCRQTEPYDLTRLDGGDPSYAAVVKWLDTLVHMPAR